MSNLKTMLFICFVIAVVFFAAAIAFAFESRKKKWKEITPFRILFGGSFLTVFTLMLPAAYYSFITENPCWFFRGLMRFLFALHNTLQTFTIDVGAKDVIENLTAAYSDNSWLTLYRAFLMVFMLISPVFTDSGLSEKTAIRSGNLSMTSCLFPARFSERYFSTVWSVSIKLFLHTLYTKPAEKLNGKNREMPSGYP